MASTTPSTFNQKPRQQLSIKGQMALLKKQIVNILPELSLQLIHSPYLEDLYFRPRYNRYVSDSLKKLPPLTTAIDRQVVESLKQDGVCLASLDQLGLEHTDSFLTQANTIIQNLAAPTHSTQQGSNSSLKVFSTFQALAQYPEVFRWGLQDRLTAIAENYIQTPVGYDTFRCDYATAPCIDKGQRRWHIDHEDRRMVKIIVYLNDVDIDTGPFEYLDYQSTQYVLSQLSLAERYRYLSHQRLTSLLPNDPEPTFTPCLGKAGTVIFIDTVRFFHRGRIPIAKPRHAALFGYVSRRPQHPFRCSIHGVSPQQLQTLAQDLPPHQQSRVLWKDTLPPPARFVPKYRYGG